MRLAFATRTTSRLFLPSSYRRCPTSAFTTTTTATTASTTTTTTATKRSLSTAVATAAAAARTPRTTSSRRSAPSFLAWLTATLALHRQQPIAPAAAFSSWFGGGFGSMAPFQTERGGDGTVTVSPKNEADQTALVVISHGLGDSAEGFVDVAEMLVAKLPYVKCILPTAPVQPVTLNGGMSMNSWYDIVGLDERSNENCPGIEKSQSILADLLQTEHDNTGLPYERMVLMGFSQGGALSIFTGLQLPKALAGIVLLSGYLPAAKKFTITPGLEDKVPIFHGHGTQDMVVQYQMAEKSKHTVVEEKGLSYDNYNIKSYPIGHTVSPDEIKDVEAFLSEVLPPDDSFKIKLKDPSEMSIKELRTAIRKAGLASKAVGLCEKSEFVRLLQDHRAGKL